MLEVADRTYGIQSGDRFRWEDSYCSRMVVGEAPQIAGDSRTIESFRSQGINLHATIRSYLGAPIRAGDGTLFGTLCAIHPDIRRFDECRVATWLEKSAETLNSALALEEARFRRDWESLERRTSGARFGIHRTEDWLEFVALARRRALSIGTTYGILLLPIPTRGNLVGPSPSLGDWRVEMAEALLHLMSRPALIGRVGQDHLGVLFERGTERSLERLLAALRIRMASTTDRVPPFVYAPIDAWSPVDAGVAPYLISPDAA